MPINTPTGYLDITNATLRGSKIVTTGNVGIANANPVNHLSVGSNLHINDTHSNVLQISGNINAASVVLGGISIAPTFDLEIVTNTGNTTPYTVEFNNTATAFVTTANATIGNILTASKFVGDGSGISAIQSSNVTDFVSNVSRIGALESSTTTLESGNMSISGDKTFTGDVVFESNVHMNGGNVFVANTVNLTVSDPIIELGSNNSGTNDLGIIMIRHGATNSNVAVVYDEDVDILRMGYTLNGADDTTVDLDSNALAVSVQGALSAASVSGDGSGLTSLNASNITTGALSTTTVTIDDYLIHDGDTDTKVGFPSADTFTVTTANSERLRVDSSGNVGIGTASPLSPLDILAVKGITTAASVDNLVSNATIRISGYAENQDALCIGMLGTDTVGDSGNNPYAYIQNVWDNPKTARPLLLNPAGGSVGIGTTSPVAQLHVASNGPTYTAIGGNDRFRIEELVSNGNKFGLQMGIDWGTGHSALQTYALSSGGTYSQNYSLLLQPHGGNVGINESSPTSKLHIDPGTNSTQSPSTTGVYVYNSGTGDSTCTLRVKDSSAGDPYIAFDAYGEAGWSMGMDNSDSNKFKLSSRWDTVATDTRLTVLHNNGHVGIGTIHPDYLLDVNGTTRVGNILYVGKNTDDETAKTIFFGGTVGDNDYNHTVIERRIYSTGTEKQELLLFCGNDGETASGPDRIRLKGSHILFDTLSGTQNARTTENTKMIIKANGNVGIGMTSPDSKLQVEHSSGDICRFYRPTSTSGQPATILLGRNSSTNDTAQFRYVYGGSTNNSSSRIDLGFYGNGSILNVTAGGRVGIGNTNPSGKLHVSGEINASAFTVRDTGSFGNSFDGVFMRPDGQVYISVDDHFYIRDNQSTSSSVRRHHLDTNSGNFRCTGNVSGGASLDYAEYFEWFDGNPDNEDRIGCSVSLVENTTKIKKCEPGEIPLGVVSGSPSMVGGEAGILWAGYWKNDEWGRPTYKQLEDDNGELVFNEDGTPKMKRAINPEYDENLANEYLPRSERKEWACVGLLGQVFVKKGAVTSKNWIKMKEIDAIKDIWFINATFTNNENIENQLQAEKTKTATLETQVAALLARVTALENA